MDITNYLKFKKLSLYECFACMYVCVQCTSMISRGQKRESNALELELQLVVNHHVGAKN